MTTSRSRGSALVALVASALAAPGRTRRPPPPAASKTRADVEVLASDRLGGRQAGSEGARLAADHLVAELKKLGAQPLPGQKDFRLPFSFTAGVKDGGTTLQVSAPPDGDARGVAQFDTTPQVQALSFSDNAEVSGAGGLRRLRAGRPRVAELRLRQLRHARRQGQGRGRAALLPRGRRPEDPRPSSRATPTCATRRCRRASAAPRRCWWSPVRAHRTPARPSR